MKISLFVSTVTQAVGSETVKFGAVKNADPKATVVPGINSFIGVTIKDPAQFGTFKPGQTVNVTIEAES